MVGFAVCFMGGVWLGSTVGVPFPQVLLCASGLLALCWAHLANGRGAPGAPVRSNILLHAVIFCAGWHVSGFAAREGPYAKELICEPLQGRVEVRGEVCGGVEATERDGHRFLRFPLRVSAVRIDGEAWVERHERLRVAWKGCLDLLPAYGEIWQIRGRVVGHDDADHSRKRPLILLVHGYPRLAQRLSIGRAWAPVRWCYEAREEAAQSIVMGIEDYSWATSVIQAMVLGYRSRLDRTTSEFFASTGTLHIFAISGLHVGIFCGLLIFVLKAARVPLRLWFAFLAPLLIGYTVATGAKPSAVRACIMALVYFMAPALRRQPDTPSALATAGLLIVLCAPSQLFEPGFVFSFVVVLGIVVFYPLLRTVLFRPWKVDPLRVQDEGPGIRAGRAVARYVCSLFAVSCSAWVVAAPLTAYYFGRFSPVALIANLVVVPLAFLIVTGGCLSLVAGACWGWLGEMFNHANLALVWLLVKSNAVMAAFPYGYNKVSRPSTSAILLWYAGIAVAALGLHFHRRQRQVRERPAQSDLTQPGSDRITG